MKFSLPDLSYEYTALEPAIDARTMEIHHQKHHAGYVAKLNAALETTPELAEKTLEELLTSIESLPENVQTAIRNNGGGHYNHSLFWEVMGGSGESTGDLLSAVETSFGSVEKLQESFSTAAGTRFGSGWAWLGVDKRKKLVVCSTANQDNPLMSGIVDCECTPILGLDVWEHAYYLNYQNRRPDYVSAWFSIINWEVVGAKYTAAMV